MKNQIEVGSVIDGIRVYQRVYLPGKMRADIMGGSRLCPEYNEKLRYILRLRSYAYDDNKIIYTSISTVNPIREKYNHRELKEIRQGIIHRLGSPCASSCLLALQRFSTLHPLIPMDEI